MSPARNLSLSLMLLGAASFIPMAQADTINLVGGWNLNWNVDANPTQSPSVSIQIENAAPPSDQVFNGYDLGLKFELISGSGQVALGSVSNPTSNSIVPAWNYSPPVGGALLNSNTVYNVASSDSLDYEVPNTPTNLVTVDFEPGAIAPAPGSVFQVLSDYNLSDYVDHSSNSTQYANNATSDFVLGTITVVPEPGSLLLLLAAALGIASESARRMVCRGRRRERG